MKSATLPRSQSILSGKTLKNVKAKHIDIPFVFREFTLPQNMTNKEVEPPAHVWEKIARALDEQERKELSKETAKILSVGKG